MGRMRWKDAIWLAIASLAGHKLRSGLVILGVTMAVSALVMVMAVIDGMGRYVCDTVGSYGPGVFVVSRMGLVTSVQEWLRFSKRRRLQMEDYHGLKKTLKRARTVAASGESSSTVRGPSKELPEVWLCGVTANYLQVALFKMGRGRFISEQDDHHRRAVCVLGDDIAEGLFPGRDPVGKRIYVNGHPHTVVGVADKQGSLFGDSLDYFVIIPLTTYTAAIGSAKVNLSIHVQAFSPEDMPAAMDEAELAMRGRRHLKPSQPDDFGMETPDGILAFWQEITGTISSVALAMAVIFLVVGGIVVMNIMLSAVMERTREIGIRKALGARRLDILLQFLLESVTLTAGGGVTGAIVACLFTRMVNDWTPLHARVSPGILLGSVAVSTVVGLFFGIYPANRAARLDPIVASRME